MIYYIAGLTRGSTIALLAARIIGLPLVPLVLSRETLEKFCFLSERRGTALAFILYLFPGFPKEVLCYVLGMSPMGFLNFLEACGLGRIPGTVILSFGGPALNDENWFLLAVVTGVCVPAIVIFFVFRQKIEVWLKKSGGKSLTPWRPSCEWNKPGKDMQLFRYRRAPAIIRSWCRLLCMCLESSIYDRLVLDKRGNARAGIAKRRGGCLIQ